MLLASDFLEGPEGRLIVAIGDFFGFLLLLLLIENVHREVDWRDFGLVLLVMRLLKLITDGELFGRGGVRARR